MISNINKGVMKYNSLLQIIFITNINMSDKNVVRTISVVAWQKGLKSEKYKLSLA